ncbi:MAG TPA: hypothetical protein VF366_07505 [Dehalococcoidia bacterium]|jgi:hypothetical protein
MIKILIVLEEEGGIEFRAYSLQISNSADSLTTQVKMSDMVETNEGTYTGNNLIPGSSSSPESNDGHSFAHRIKKPLETKQIFMN